MIWILLVVVAAVVLVAGAIVWALARSAATDSASVNEEYQESLRARDQETAGGDAMESPGSPDEFPV